MFFHVDINSYFATMLQQENPSLRGKPIGVIKDVGRTCVIASSNEAKKMGVKTGFRVKEARQLCPDIILVPANFDILLATTHKLKKIFNQLSPDVHIFSLDEAFLNLTGCETLMRQLNAPTAQAYGQLIQARIRETLGEWVKCNVGISHNKLLAKLASETSPKGSIFQIDEHNLTEVLSRVSFKDVCGVGSRLERRLAILGVTTPYQINLLDDGTLLEHFGPFWSGQLRAIGRGEETHFLTHVPQVPHMQSVGRTITGYKLYNDEGEIRRVLLNLLEEVTYKLRWMELSGRGVGIFLSGRKDSWGKHSTLKYYVRHTNEIFDLLYGKFYGEWQRTFPVLKFGVFVYDLKSIRDIPLCLLPSFQKNEALYRVMDKINNRFGLYTLKPASLLGDKVIRPEVTGYLGDKAFHGL